MIYHQSTDSEPRLYRTHHWLFERFIRSAGGLKLLLRLILSKAQLELICLDQIELVATKSTHPDDSSQDADVIALVPLKNSNNGTDSIYILIEMKSKGLYKLLDKNNNITHIQWFIVIL